LKGDKNRSGPGSNAGRGQAARVSEPELACLVTGALSVKPEPLKPGELEVLLAEVGRRSRELTHVGQRFSPVALVLCASGLALAGIVAGPTVGPLRDIRSLVLAAVLANLALSPLGALAVVLGRRSSYAR